MTAISRSPRLRAGSVITFTMLFDTGALAWDHADRDHRAPSGVIFLRTDAFTALRHDHAQWAYAANGYDIVDEQGHFVSADAIVAPSTDCGGVVRTKRLIVERKDPTTCALMKRTFGVDVQGDASLSAFGPGALTIDLRGGTLRVHS